MLDEFHLAYTQVFPEKGTKWSKKKFSEVINTEIFSTIDKLTQMNNEDVEIFITSYGFILALSDNMQFQQPLEEEGTDQDLGFDSLKSMIDSIRDNEKAIQSLSLTVGELKSLIKEGMKLYNLQDSAKLKVTKTLASIEITNASGRMKTSTKLGNKSKGTHQMYLDLGLIYDTLEGAPDYCKVEYIEDQMLLVRDLVVDSKENDLNGLYVSNLN